MPFISAEYLASSYPLDEFEGISSSVEDTFTVAATVAARLRRP
ncbi:MAG TPA: hypothetical protein VI357_22760 [Mycobacteriales bacterium]